VRDNLFKLLSLCSSMKKELGFVFILFFSVVFVLAYSSSIPNPGHGADEIFVYINGKVLSLQSAIDSSEFNRNSYSGGGVSSNIVFGHGDVYVNVGGVNKNLQSAINDNSLCLFDGGAGVYSGVESVGHSADKILVNFNGERSLQATINQGLFAGKWDKVASDVCNGQSFTRSRCGISEAGTGTKTTGECAVCVASSWTPATNTYCSGTSFTQTSNCGTTRSATGIKTTGECCVASSWTPATNTYCSGTSFTQYSNCGTTRSATGTKTTGECAACVASSWTPATNTVCSGTSFTQTSNCGTTRSAVGTKPLKTVCSDPAGGYDRLCTSTVQYNTIEIRTVPANTAAVASDTVACMNHCNSMASLGPTCCELWYSMDHTTNRRLLCAAMGGSPTTSYVDSEIHWASTCTKTC